ncbi:MAG: YfcE family phosphodiesterase [Promethearchaeota archaeon]|nr:MAG: YfcE family phosphodiesterase [Candidatus Lokiarchaeota archaeon]
MSVEIVIIGDTHALTFEELPKEMLKAIQRADYVIHVGDYTSKNVLDGLIRLKGQQFKGVYGNTDPQAIRNMVPSKQILEIKGKRIGITHPAVGGLEKYTLKRAMAKFRNKNVDAIIYGHTHEPVIKNQGNIILFNPGKGYLEDGQSASFGIITIDKEIKSKIQEIGV